MSRSVALVGRGFEGVGKVCHRRRGGREVRRVIVRNLLIYLRRAKRWRAGREMFNVGASLLAKVVNDDAGILDERGALGFFASKLAPTERDQVSTLPR
ncbi:hypothetical protein BLL36_20525 [Pseudomonas cedrina subsp. cedrina]|uniref:Uncharacterized protein n=1 Tax=Pseudomonas cedrina subsp. cedrina TaxID=76762 RepID=A0A1V2K2D5_PSECE|nr:hypothetical protein BLL36_20525 [Pseudomonas cedrina subsp. cedrina]